MPSSWRSPVGVAFVPLLATAASLVACGQPPSPAAKDVPQRGGTVVVGSTSDISSVNELLAAGTEFDLEITEKVFARLLVEQPDYQEHPPTFAPNLAESYEWAEDRSSLTFRLRPEARWSDGEPITAHDVRWTWKVQTSPEIGWAFADLKEAIRDVEVIDEHTARFHLTDSYPSLLADVNEGVVLPRHAWGQVPLEDWRESSDWFRDNMVSSGPFLLEQWQPQQQIVLVPNPTYWDEEVPRLERVVVRIVPEMTNLLAQLRSGDVDFVEQVPAREATSLDEAEDVEVLEYWSRQYNYIAWNTTRELFSDPEVRRALTMGIDRQEIVDTLWFGRARVASSPIISSVWAHDASLTPWPHDPAEARRILDARGWRDTDGDGILERNGTPFSFELLTNSGAPVRSDATVMIQAQLREIGVDAKPVVVELNSLVGRGLEHDFDALLLGWNIDTSLDLHFAFHSESADGGYNWGAYSNPAVDELIDTARRQPDLESMKDPLLRVQQILHEEQPYTFLWEPQGLTALRSHVRGAEPNALFALFNLHEWWLAPLD